MTGHAFTRHVVPPVLAAALGVLAGWLWWTWWGPAPQGQLYETDSGLKWYPMPFDPGITADFSSTAIFTVLAVVGGFVYGLAVAGLHRNAALVGMVLALVGAGVALGAMLVVGIHFSPPDPMSLLGSHHKGDQLPGHMGVTGWTPYLVWPGATLLGYVTLLLALPPERADQDDEAVSSETTWSAPLPWPAATE